MVSTRVFHTLSGSSILPGATMIKLIIAAYAILALGAVAYLHTADQTFLDLSIAPGFALAVLATIRLVRDKWYEIVETLKLYQED